MRRMTVIGIVAAAAIAVGCGAGTEPSVEQDTGVTAGTAAAENDPPPAKPKTPAKVGGVLNVKASGVNASWTLSKVEQKAADQYGGKPDNGGQWVLVQVKVQVKDGREAYVCSCDLSIISKSKRVYEPTYASFKSRPDLTVTTVAPGQNTDGWVIFGVAKADLPGAQLQLKQSSLFDDTAFGYWTLGTK